MEICKKNPRKLLSRAILAASIASIVSPALALELEEIVVTAQKREQNLQDIPISVSALQSDALQQRGVVNTETLGQAVPGLVISRQLIAIAPIIRGVGQANLAPGADLGVATYIDGVYQPSSTGSNLSLANIDRIEVLRGPQGTLFGRNATGGLMHIITKNPEQEFGGKAAISYSDPETVEGKIYVTGGLTDRVSANFSAVITEQDEGYGTNLATGEDTYWRDETVVRGKILFKISDDSSLLIAADYADMETDFALSRRFSSFAGSTPLSRPDGQPNPKGFWDINYPRNNFATNEQWGIAATYDKAGEHFDTKVIASYRELESLISLEQSWSFLQLFDFTSPATEETFTAELQLISNESSAFEWIIGAYYLDAKPRVDGIEATIGFGSSSWSDVVSQIDTESIAIYGQSTFDLTDQLSLTAGLRWTRDEKELTASFTSNPVITALPSSVSQDDSWSELTWRLSMDYTFSDDLLGYLSYNRGFKSGIYNLFQLPIPFSPAVAPEFVDTYEMGLKGDFLDGSLRLNAAIYYNDYTDIQLQTTLSGQNILTNAGEAKTYGGELELNYLATENLQLYVNAALTKTEYTEFENAQFLVPNVGQCPTQPVITNCAFVGDASGNQFNNIPEMTFNVGAIYERAVSFGTAGFNANVFWSDERKYGFNNIHTEDSYAVVTADVFARFGTNQQHELRIFARNLTDEEYLSLYQPSTINTVEDPNPGRSVGISYSLDF